MVGESFEVLVIFGVDFDFLIFCTTDGSLSAGNKKDAKGVNVRKVDKRSSGYTLSFSLLAARIFFWQGGLGGGSPPRETVGGLGGGSPSGNCGRSGRWQPH